MSLWLPVHSDRASNYPPLLVAAPSLVLLALFVFRPSSLAVRITLLSVLTYTALIPPLQYTSGNPAADFGISSSAFQRCLIAFDRFYLTSIDQLESTFIRQGQIQAPPPGLNLARLTWSIENTLLMRGAGMKWEVKGIPSGGRQLGRGRFVATRFLRATITYLAMDLVSTIMQADAYFRRQQTISQVTFSHRLVIVMCAGSAGGLALELLYDLVSAAGVLVGIWTPRESPDLFGSLGHAYTLRGFWGKTWHQCFRRVFVSANALILALNLRPGSTAALLVSLFVPFVLSAAQHAYAIRVMGGPGYGTKTSAFFLLQPCGILLESLVRKPFSRTKSTSIWTRLMGHLWVLSWMLSCGHLFFDELVQAGMWEVNPAPFSVVKGLTRGEWWAP